MTTNLQDQGVSGRCLTAQAVAVPVEPFGLAGFATSILIAGSIREVARYRRADLRANPSTLFVFGDNVSTLGRGGQARECRGEPNAVGIPTKWHPTMDEDAFFTDADLPKVMPRIQAEFRKLAAHLATGGDVVWPADGVGTGLADLPRRAPKFFAYLERCRAHLAQGIDAAKADETGTGSAVGESPVA